MNTIADYHDIYLKADVLVLADVFQKFISTYLKVVSTTFLLACFFKSKREHLSN